MAKVIIETSARHLHLSRKDVATAKFHKEMTWISSLARATS